MADERPTPGIDTLQAAALAVIGAARQFLDVAEQLVRDPDAAQEAVAAAATLARAAVESVLPGAASAGRPAADEPIEHIDVT